MATIGRGQSSSCADPILDVYLRRNDAPTDVAVLEYIILDATGATPTQTYPVSGRQAANVAACPAGDKLSTGRYVARWTVPDAQPVGKHVIRWFFKETLLGAEMQFEEAFEVTAQASELADGNGSYITVRDLREIGLTEADVSDYRAAKLIKLTQQLIERVTRQWFEPRTSTLRIDGADSDKLLLPVPVISVSSIRINNDPNVLDANLYRVFNGRSNPDDRKNPKIQLVWESGDIFTAPIVVGPLRFQRGTLNQEITGSFGYVEEDLSTPEAIKHAQLKMVVERITSPVFTPTGTTPPGGGGSGTIAGVVIEEETDGHRVRYSAGGSSGGGSTSTRRSGFSGITQDPEVLDILMLYRAPIIGSPVTSRWITL